MTTLSTEHNAENEPVPPLLKVIGLLACNTPLMTFIFILNLLGRLPSWDNLHWETLSADLVRLGVFQLAAVIIQFGVVTTTTFAAARVLKGAGTFGQHAAEIAWASLKTSLVALPIVLFAAFIPALRCFAWLLAPVAWSFTRDAIANAHQFSPDRAGQAEVLAILFGFLPVLLVVLGGAVMMSVATPR